MRLSTRLPGPLRSGASRRPRGRRKWRVDQLQTDDLSAISWAGGTTHIDYVARALDRVASGEVDYLAIRDQYGQPRAIGGIDYDEPRCAMLFQLVTEPAYRSQGLGRWLIRELESQARQRGWPMTGLGVEVDNARARSLYEQLGYWAVGQETTGWWVETVTDEQQWYQATVTVMTRPL